MMIINSQKPMEKNGGNNPGEKQFVMILLVIMGLVLVLMEVV